MKKIINFIRFLFRRKRLQDYVPDEVIERNKEAQYLRALQMNIKLKHQNDKLRDTISRLNAREFASFRNIQAYHNYIVRLFKIIRRKGDTPPKDIVDFDMDIVTKLFTNKTKKK